MLKWQLDDEEYILQATALRNNFYAQGSVKVIAPHLLIYEVVNGIASATRHKRVDSKIVVEAITNLIALGIELKEVDTLIVLELALKYNLAAYDTAYLTLAEAESCELWTGDRSFYETVSSKFPWVKWIGDYIGEQTRKA